MLAKLLHWLKNSVAEVPGEIAVCEFDCSRTQCLRGDWLNCERRLQAQAPEQREKDTKAG